MMASAQYYMHLVTIYAVFPCVGSSAESSLLSELLDEYNTNVRPVRSWGEPIQLDVGFTLSRIFSMDETAQILMTKSWINLKWQDEFLSWQPSDHHNIYHIMIPSGNIWRPDLVMYNNNDDTILLDYSEDFKLHVDHHGRVTFRFPIIGRTTCPLEMRYFPWDIQVCPFRFALWTYDGDHVNMSIQWADSRDYAPSSEWRLLGVTSRRREYHYPCCPGDWFPDLTFYVVIQRHPITVVFSSIIPTVLVQGMALLAFYLSPASAGHISLGMAFLLAILVFLWQVASVNPVQSTHVPVLSVYILTAICVVMVGLFPSALITSLYLNMCSERRLPPAWLRTLCLRWLAKGLRLEGLVTSSLHAKKEDNAVTLDPQDSDTPENGKVKLHPTRRMQVIYHIGKMLLRIGHCSSDAGDFNHKTHSTLPRCKAIRWETTNGSSNTKPCKIFMMNHVESSQCVFKDDETLRKVDDIFNRVPYTASLSYLQQCLLHARGCKDQADLTDQKERWFTEWLLIIHVFQRLLLVIFTVVTISILLGLGILQSRYELDEHYEEDLLQELADFIDNA